MSSVLIVEDDTWQAEHYAAQLTKAGHHVQTAGHALRAMEVIDQTAPDVIVLDLFLPGANGMTLLHELRSHADLAGVPVIVSSTDSVNLASLKPYGVHIVLDKTTMVPADLTAAVREVTS